MKTLEIKIKSEKESHKEFAQTFKDIQAGKKVKPNIGIYFASLDAVRNLLTPKRLELLRAIREQKPKSISELARLCGRDFKNVYEDVQTLKWYGLVQLPKESAKRNGKESVNRIAVPYQAINIHAGI